MSYNKKSWEGAAYGITPYYLHSTGSVVATLESTPFPTVRRVNCLILIPRDHGSCSVCRVYRDTLYALQYKPKRRLSNAHPEEPNSYVNFRYLSHNQKVQRMHNMKAVVQAARSRLIYLEKQLVDTTKVKSVEVNSELHGA